MWANPIAIPLINGTLISVKPIGSQFTRPRTVILTNSSAFTCQIQSSTGLVRFLPAWTADTFDVDPNNPTVNVIPTIAIPTSTPYDTSLYVSWVGEHESLPASYPQSLTPNILPTAPPGVSRVPQVATAVLATVTTQLIIAPPGVGNSIYLNTIILQMGFTGGPNIGSLSIVDGLGNTYAMFLQENTNSLLPPMPFNLNGFKVLGDNAGLDVVVNAAGAATVIALAHITYYVGVTI